MERKNGVTMYLRWPLAPEFRRITQYFGENPAFYRPFGLNGHEGLDVAAPVGTPVTAMHAGIVTVLSAPASYGLYLQLWGDEVMTLYAHLSEAKVAGGQVIAAGETIGLSGNTGRSTGPHLHFGVCPLPRDIGNGYKGWVNPLSCLEDMMTTETLAAAIRARFEWEEIVRLLEDAKALRAQAAECLAQAQLKEDRAFVRLSEGVNTRDGVAYRPEVLLGGNAPAGWEG